MISQNFLQFCIFVTEFKKDFLRPRLKKSLDGVWITTDVLFSRCLNVLDLNAACHLHLWGLDYHSSN